MSVKSGLSNIGKGIRNIFSPPKQEATVTTTTPATYYANPTTGKVSEVTPSKTSAPVPVRGSGGGSSTPTDATFTTGGTASGQGGNTYNPATNASQTNAPLKLNQPYTFNYATGSFENTNRTGQSQSIGLPTPTNPYNKPENYYFNQINPAFTNTGTTMNIGLPNQQGYFKTYGQMYNEGYSVSDPKPSTESLKTAGLGIGLTAVSIVAPAIVLPVAGAIGMYGFGKAYTSYQDANPSTIMGKQVVIGGENKYSNFKFSNVNTPQFEANALAGFIAVGVTAGTYIPYLERSILAEQISSAPVFDYSKATIIKGETGQYDFIKVSGVSGSGLTTEVSAWGKTITTPEGTFFTPLGTGTSTTTGAVRNILNSKTGTNYFGTSTFQYGTKGVSTEANNFIYSLGKTNVVPVSSYSAVYSNPSQLAFDGKLKLGGETLTGYQISSSKSIAPDMFGNERYITAGYKSNINNRFSPFMGTSTVIENNKLNIAGFERGEFSFTSFNPSGTTGFTGNGLVTTQKIIPSVSSSAVELGATTSQIIPRINAFGTSGFTGLITNQKTSTSLGTSNLQILNTGLTTKGTTKTASGLYSPSALAGRTTTGQGSSLIQVPALNIAQKTGTIGSTYTPAINSNRGFYTPNTIPLLIPGISFPLFGAGGGMSSKLYTGKQRKKYTPDFFSLVTGKRGKAPIGFGSAEKSRPITKGFSFFNSKSKFKMPKFKL